MHLPNSNVPYDHTKSKLIDIKTVYVRLLPTGRVVQSVTYLSADTCLSGDPGVASSILNRSHGD